MYKDDRQRIHTMLVHGAAGGPGAHSGESGDSGDAPAQSPTSNSIKPRSILVDKQYTSAPNTPVVRNPTKPMHRNLSDLGPRIKKRVTYRCMSSEGSDYAREGPPPSPLTRTSPPPYGEVEEEEMEEGSREIPVCTIVTENEAQSEADSDQSEGACQLSPQQERLESNSTLTEMEYLSDAESNSSAQDDSNENTSLMHGHDETFHRRPESNALLMRPEVLKLRKTFC